MSQTPKENAPGATSSLSTVECKRALKAFDDIYDDIELPLGGDFYQQLHDKIMAQIEQTEIKPISKTEQRIQLTKNLVQKNWRKIFYSGTVGIALMVLCFQSTQMVDNLWRSYHVQKLSHDSTISQLAENRLAYMETIAGSGSVQDIFSSLAANSDQSLNQGLNQSSDDDLASRLSSELLSK